MTDRQAGVDRFCGWVNGKPRWARTLIAVGLAPFLALAFAVLVAFVLVVVAYEGDLRAS